MPTPASKVKTPEGENLILQEAARMGIEPEMIDLDLIKDGFETKDTFKIKQTAEDRALERRETAAKIRANEAAGQDIKPVLKNTYEQFVNGIVNRRVADVAQAVSLSSNQKFEFITADDLMLKTDNMAVLDSLEGVEGNKIIGFSFKGNVYPMTKDGLESGYAIAFRDNLGSAKSQAELRDMKFDLSEKEIDDNNENEEST